MDKETPMKDETHGKPVRMIPVDLIEVLNPRERNQKKWEEEVLGSMRLLGLKKPVSVTPRTCPDGIVRYLLICGEGRLKAAKALNWTKIPAVVEDATDQRAIVMSLLENITKNKRTAADNLAGIQLLVDAHYTPREIAEKVGHVPGYIQGILTLLKQGEKRLLEAVEKGSVPISVALTIVGAGEDDKTLQVALQDAYQAGQLRGRRLYEVRQLIARRKRDGKSPGRPPGSGPEKKEVTTASLVRTYEREVARQKLMVRKADHSQQRFLLTVSALRRLYADENFVTLLRAEKMESLPKDLATRVWSKGGAV